MSHEDSTEEFVADPDLAEYLHFAVGAPYHGGFSKGTANVSPHDVQKLHGLLDYYAKKPHPFTACVRDNRKRFGPLVNQYCAVLKDVIEGNTKWRKGGHKSTKGVKLSEAALIETFALDVPEEFWTWLSEVDHDDYIERDKQVTEQIGLAAGDLAWDTKTSYTSLKQKLCNALNGTADSGDVGEYNSPSDVGPSGYQYWVDDINTNDSNALVCDGTGGYYVVGFTQDKKTGDVTVSDETDWTPVAEAWVEANVNFADNLLAEMFFEDEPTAAVKEEDGLVWKTIIREGKFAYSPGGKGKPVNKPITVVKSGVSDPKSLTISIEELKNNFDNETVEHVTVPTSHEDKVTENTGFVRKMRVANDEKGRQILQAGIDFTEPDVKEKALRGTIANISSGIVFDHIHKESGKKVGAVVLHAALTNHPWLNGLKPFGVNASENYNIISFSEELENGESRGGDTMPEVETKEDTFLSEIGLSEDQVRAALAQNEEFKKELRQGRITAQVAAWEADKKSPAMIKEAQVLLSMSSDEPILALSQDGKEVKLSTEDVIKRLMDAAPQVLLAEDVVNDRGVTDDKPEDDTEAENFSAEERLVAASLFLEEGLGQAEAQAEAKRRVAAKTTSKV